MTLPLDCKRNMNSQLQNRRTRDRFRRSGAILVLFAILLPILLMIAGFGLFIAKAQLLRTELRSATDFAARAGAKQLSLQQTRAAGVAGAIEAAGRNTVGEVGFALTANEVVLGLSRQSNGDNSRFQFTPSGGLVNAVQVNATAPGNDPIISLFSRLARVTTRDFRLNATATNLDRDICVVIDRSGSMTQPVSSRNNGTFESCGPLRDDSRFAALARAVREFAAELDRTPQLEQVCLASYSSPVRIACRCCDSGCNSVSERCRGGTSYFLQFPEAESHSDLSGDTNVLLPPLGSMLSRGIGGSTAIGSGLNAGLDAVLGPNSRPFAAPTIVLMTDGVHNRGVAPEVVAQRAADLGIVVHTITFSRGADQARMREVARITGGIHLHADTEDDLLESFREIANTLPVMLTN